MGKKKRQEFHSANLEKPKDQEGGSLCIHTAKSINLNRLKPKRNPKLQQKRLGILDSPASENKESLWICLKCAQLDCGCKQHTDNRPADLHIISFNVNTKKVWCNVCNIYLGPKENQKVNRALQYLKQHLKDTYETYETEKIEDKIKHEPEDKKIEKKETKGVVKSHVQIPRGLKNLGNTCYFNVVLQCLARTPNFIYQMEKLKEERILTLETNMLKHNPEKVTEVKLKVDKWMDFSNLLLKSLVELNMPERKPYVPIKLLNELHRVSNTITKDEQHDAHELLREVLQKIKEVDVQKLKSAICTNFNSPNSVSKERMEETIQQMIKSYENHTEKKSFLEEIFGGILISILKCQECGNTSYTSEPFLDLSLPITNKTVVSFEMKVNEDIKTNQRRKQGSQQRKKNYSGNTVNKKTSVKNEETEQSEADVEDSFKQEAKNYWYEESGYDQENLVHPLKSPLSSRSPVPSIANDDKVLNLPSPCANFAYSTPAIITENSMSSAKEAESKLGEHQDCIKSLNCDNVDTSLGAPVERIMSAVEVESKVSEHKGQMENEALLSVCCNSSLGAKNVGDSPVTPENKSESIIITAEATEIHTEQEDYMKYLPVSLPCSKTAGTIAAIPIGNSSCDTNAAEGGESQDRKHEESEKNLPPATTSPSSLSCEFTGSPLSDRDTPSPISSEINIDCSVSIRMHAGCSSPVSPDCNGYRPVSRIAFCDDADSITSCSTVNEISSMSKVAVNELNSKSSNHIISPVKLNTSNETSCNDIELLECPDKSSSVKISEYSRVNLNQTEILESVKKLSLSDDDSLDFYAPPNYRNVKGKMSPEIKQKRRKNQSDKLVKESSPDCMSSFTLACCLENFSALEVMTDCEKVACSLCTEKNGKGEIVFTTSTKQIQIKSTPAVLILHLKRFEFKADGGCSKTRRSTRPKKLNRHIQFPIVLDVSPYIYNENEENFRPRQKESLYSLYAVIEHSGSINQGHYIAYVKSRAAKTDASHLKDVNENEYKDEGMSLPAKWFSISDECVQRVDENDVLGAQAYILFYEKC